MDEHLAAEKISAALVNDTRSGAAIFGIDGNDGSGKSTREARDRPRFPISLASEVRALQSNFTVAHFGMFRGQSGAASAGFKRFLELLRHGERRCWVKLTAPYRIGSPPFYENAVPIAPALIEAAPDRVIWGSDYPFLSHADRVIWGSDYPFLSHADRVNATGLFSLIPTWAPDESVRKQILVDNPQELFGF